MQSRQSSNWQQLHLELPSSGTEIAPGNLAEFLAPVLPHNVYSAHAKKPGYAAPLSTGMTLLPQQPWMSERFSQDSQNIRAPQVVTDRIRICCTIRVVKRASGMASCGCCPHTFPGLCPAHSKLVLFPWCSVNPAPAVLTTLSHRGQDVTSKGSSDKHKDSASGFSQCLSSYSV